MASEGSSLSEHQAKLLSEWRQGDFSTDVPQFAVVDGIEEGNLTPLALDVPGFAVVSQTCDIVNYGEVREYVVVAPFKKASPNFLKEVEKSRTPAAARIENPPEPDLVVDLNRMMTLDKRLLASLRRQEGFSTDEGRQQFADALARKHSRFAFPDKFSAEVLGPIRKKIISSHGKASKYGQCFASIRHIRVSASPQWDADEVSVGFLIILHEPDARKASLEEISSVIKELFVDAEWPQGYKKSEPPFVMQRMEDFSALDWVSSQAVDWDFVSNSS